LGGDKGSGFRVRGSGFGVQGSGFRVQNWIEKNGELFVGGIGIFERGREKHFYDQGGMN
jgi:hypothetical protein